MRLTEHQRRERAYREAIGRSSAGLSLNSDKEIAEYLRVGQKTYAMRKSKSFISGGMKEFCRVANALGFTDEEVLRIVRSKE